MSAADVCVVVPVFNEEKTVATVVSDLRREFDHVLCVDDGSTDDSVAAARSAGAEVVRHSLNLGQGAALQTGFDYILRYTDAEYCVTFDADGQHLVSDAVHMVEVLRSEGADVALASRFRGSTQDMPRVRGWVLRGGVWFTRRTAGLDVTDTHNGLRVLRRSALERIRLSLPRMAYASELLSAIRPNGLTYVEVPVEVIYSDYSRAKGQRNINAVNILFDLAAQRVDRPMIIKILLIGAALGFGVLLLRERFPGQRLAVRRLLGLGVVLAGVLAVMWPDAVSWVANRVGVGRGTDLVVYVLVMVFLYTTLAMHQRIHNLESKLTDLTRALALDRTRRARSSAGAGDEDAAA